MSNQELCVRVYVFMSVCVFTLKALGCVDTALFSCAIVSVFI